MPDVPFASIGMVPAASDNQLHPDTVNVEKAPENDDETIHLSDDDSDDDSIKSVTTSTTNNPYNNDTKDLMIKHASDMKGVKDRYTTPVTI